MLFYKLCTVSTISRDEFAANKAIDAMFPKAEEQSLNSHLLSNSNDVGIICHVTPGQQGAKQLMADLSVHREAYRCKNDQIIDGVLYLIGFLGDLAPALLKPFFDYLKRII